MLPPAAAGPASSPSPSASDYPTPHCAAVSPAICAELATGPAATGQAAHTADERNLTSLRRENARLRRDNENLAANLEVAIANIQRLTLQVHNLTEALEHARGVTRLPRVAR